MTSPLTTALPLAPATALPLASPLAPATALTLAPATATATVPTTLERMRQQVMEFAADTVETLGHHEAWLRRLEAQVQAQAQARAQPLRLTEPQFIPTVAATTTTTTTAATGPEELVLQVLRRMHADLAGYDYAGLRDKEETRPALMYRVTVNGENYALVLCSVVSTFIRRMFTGKGTAKYVLPFKAPTTREAVFKVIEQLKIPTLMNMSAQHMLKLVNRATPYSFNRPKSLMENCLLLEEASLKRRLRRVSGALDQLMATALPRQDTRAIRSALMAVRPNAYPADWERGATGAGKQLPVPGKCPRKHPRNEVEEVEDEVEDDIEEVDDGVVLLKRARTEVEDEVEEVEEVEEEMPLTRSGKCPANVAYRMIPEPEEPSSPSIYVQ